MSLVPILAFLALPWFLSRPAGRQWLLARGNHAMKPGGLTMSSLRFSWFGPTEMTDFTLIDPQGDHVVKASKAIWDRNFLQILVARLNLGTLRLENATLDAERADNGSIDLYETLRPILGRDPRTTFRIEVRDGRLQFQGAGLAKPVTSEHTDLTFELHPHPQPLNFRLALANGPSSAATDQLSIAGHIDQWAAKEGRDGNLDLAVTGKGWPIDLNLGRVSGNLKGRFDGSIVVKRDSGDWDLEGDVALNNVDATTSAFADNHLRIDSVRGEWGLKQGRDLGASIDLNGLTLRESPGSGNPGESLSLAVNAHLQTEADRWEIKEIVLKNRFLAADAAGSLSDPQGSRRWNLKGSLSPGWDAINSWLATNVEPGAVIKGRAEPFQIEGTLGPDWKTTLGGALGIGIDSADLYGMLLGPTTLTFRAKDGQLLVDPIETSLNGGRLHLEPEIPLADAKGQGLAIVLRQGSALKDAQINDKVSRRVLAFVAPVLDNATRVNGSISVEIDEAVFPIGADRAKGPTVEGDVMFQNVQFLPGPLFNDLLAIAGRSDRPLLTLNDPVALSIADRRITQSGLKVPIGTLADIEVEGWVDFDQNMNLVTSVPILPNALAGRPILGELVGDARIKIPIRGTLKAPEIDKQAFNLGMKDLGKSMLDRTVGPGLSDLIRSMADRIPARPAIPRTTPAERRERRLEKKQDRRSKQGSLP